MKELTVKVTFHSARFEDQRSKCAANTSHVSRSSTFDLHASDVPGSQKSLSERQPLAIFILMALHQNGLVTTNLRTFAPVVTARSERYPLFAFFFTAYCNLRLDFVTVLLQKSLTTLQLTIPLKEEASLLRNFLP